MKVQEIADHEGDEIHLKFAHTDLLLGFRFLADMIDRLAFVLVVIVETIALSATILTMPMGNSDNSRLDTLRKLADDFDDACGDHC